MFRLKLQEPHLLVPSSVPFFCSSLPLPCFMLSSLPLFYLLFFLYFLYYSFWSPDTFYFWSSSTFLLLFSSLSYSSSLLLPLSSLFTEGSPPTPYLVFLGAPTSFHTSTNFPSEPNIQMQSVWVPRPSKGFF